MASKRQRNAVWNKAQPVRGKNPSQFRRDVAGNVLFRGAYGKKGPKSWEVDHKRPVSKGGSNRLSNLQIMQTSENRRKGNRYPYRPIRGN